MKKIAIIILSASFIMLTGCASIKPPPPQEIIVTVKGQESDVKVSEPPCDVHKSMEVENSELSYSRYCRIHGDTAYVSFTSVNSYAAADFWLDNKLMEINGIKHIYVYMHNPGGDVAAMLTTIDQIERAKARGIEVIAEASGIVASAAIPVFLACSKRIADEYTLFLIHPSTITKFGFFSEGLDDLESQALMIRMGRERYAKICAKYSKLSEDEIIKLVCKDNWFGVDKALEWGMIDEVI